MPNIEISIRTREALKNLFDILDIEGDKFDDKLFELASRAFSAYSTLPKGHALIKRARTKQARKKIEIKQTTVDDLQDMHARLFPYLPWQSWNWYMEQILKILEDQVHEKKEDYDIHMPRQD